MKHCSQVRLQKRVYYLEKRDVSTNLGSKFKFVAGCSPLARLWCVELPRDVKPDIHCYSLVARASVVRIVYVVRLIGYRKQQVIAVRYFFFTVQFFTTRLSLITKCNNMIHGRFYLCYCCYFLVEFVRPIVSVA